MHQCGKGLDKKEEGEEKKGKLPCFLQIVATAFLNKQTKTERKRKGGKKNRRKKRTL